VRRVRSGRAEWFCGHGGGCRGGGLGWWAYAEAAASDNVAVMALCGGVAVRLHKLWQVSATRVAGSPPCAFIFSVVFVRGFGYTICCTSLLLFFVFLLFTFSVIPWSLGHYVNILPTNEIEGQQLLNFSKKKEKILGHISC
jgi:hypothetical protein